MRHDDFMGLQTTVDEELFRPCKKHDVCCESSVHLCSFAHKSWQDNTPRPDVVQHFSSSVLRARRSACRLYPPVFAFVCLVTRRKETTPHLVAIHARHHAASVASLIVFCAQATTEENEQGMSEGGGGHNDKDDTRCSDSRGEAETMAKLENTTDCGDSITKQQQRRQSPDEETAAVPPQKISCNYELYPPTAPSWSRTFLFFSSFFSPERRTSPLSHRRSRVVEKRRSSSLFVVPASAAKND